MAIKTFNVIELILPHGSYLKGNIEIHSFNNEEEARDKFYKMVNSYLRDQDFNEPERIDLIFDAINNKKFVDVENNYSLMLKGSEI